MSWNKFLFESNRWGFLFIIIAFPVWCLAKEDSETFINGMLLLIAAVHVCNYWEKHEKPHE